MIAATQHRADTPVARPAGWQMAVLWAALLVPAIGPGQEPAPEDGAFISVPTPLTSQAVNGIKAATNRALSQKDRRITVLVFDFNPGDRSATSEDYDECRSLARFLIDLQNVNTVAFVNKDVTGHLVLPVLACGEIVMAKEAKLGNVPRGLKGPLLKDELLFYEWVITGRGRIPAVALKMLDRDVELVTANRDGALWYIDRRKEAEEKKNNIIVTNPEPLPGLHAGEIGLYDGALARKLGLAQRLIETRQELAQSYGLPASSLRDPLQGRKPVGGRIQVRGEFSKGTPDSFTRSVRRMVGQQNRANFLVIELSVAGGDTVAAADVAYDFLRTLKDDNGDLPVMTVAYIPKEAPDTATFLALGCSEIVMHKDATLGDFSRHLAAGGDPSLLRKSLEGLAREQGYPHLVVRGFLEPDLVLHRVRTRKTPIERQVVTADDLVRDKALAEPRWIDEGRIKEADKLLVLDANLARELGIARHVIQDPAELYTLYGLDPAEVRLTGPDWLDRISEWLRQPVVALFLIMIGITCLILELKMPGLGLPGVMAALCFVLYFWAHSQLSGQIMWLAVLLFLLGLILIGVEVFIIPGFGITGISGVLLIILSLALVTLDKKPETTQEWVNFGGTLSMLGLSLVGALVVALLLARSLPSLPYANRLVLQPPGEATAMLEEAGLDDAASATVNPTLLALLGAIGQAVTPLRPAGIARFGDDFMDVVAESSYVEAGTRVQVIEVEGNRIVVKEV